MMIKRCLYILGWLGIFIALQSLGFWQLERAKQKQALLDSYQANQQAAAVPLAAILPVTLQQRYQKITVQGSFDNQHNFLLDNKIYQHQAGYHVITPFHLTGSNEPLLLMNRGFLAGTGQRTKLPDIPVIEGEHTLTAIIDFPPEKPFILGANYDAQSLRWPLVMQQLKVDDVSHALNTAVYPFIALLYDPSFSFQTDWQPTKLMSVSMHKGYAVQWFALAATWLILTSLLFLRHFRKKRGIS